MQRIRLGFLIVLSIAFAAPPGQASFPGENGPLVLSLESCGVESEGPRYLAQLPWDGGPLTPITDTCPSENDYRPSFEAPSASPDGRSVLASNFVVARDGSDIRPVPEPTTVYASGPASFAPSGHRFAFSGLRRAKPRRYGIWSQRLDGSGVRRIRMGCLWSACYDGYDTPQWSPDGKLLAVERARPFVGHKGRDEIALLRVRDGRIVRRLTNHGEEPDWSPDGRWLVYRTPFQQYTRRQRVNGGDLYVVSRDGSQKRLLLRRPRLAERHPTWSPDGRWITFISMYGDSERTVPKVWRIPSQGGSPVEIYELPPIYGADNPNFPELTWLSEPVEG